MNHIPLAQFEKRGAVEEQLDQLRQHLVAVNLSSNLDGVEIWIDGARIGRTPFAEDVLLEPGRHSIRAKYADTTQSKAVDLDAGAHLDLVFDLRGAESSRPLRASAQVPLPFAEHPSGSRSHARTWVLVGGAASTSIAVGIGIAMRIQSGHEQDDAKTLSQQINGVSSSGAIATDHGCMRQEQAQACDLLSRSARAAHRDRNISTGAFIAAGGLGLATVTTLLLWSPSSQQSKSEHSSPRALRFGAWFPNRTYGLSATGSF